MTLRQVLLVLFGSLLGAALSGCDLSGTTGGPGTPSVTGVYVANQGNFTDGNGSVTIYNPSTEQLQPQAISGLGSIVQGIAVRDTTLLVMANTAARIDVFSTDGPTQTAQVTGVTSPRYAAFTGPSTAYVTDQSFTGASAVRVLDLSAEQPRVVSTIPVSGSPEGIAVTGDRAYAALGAFGDTSLVATIDVTRNALEDEIDVGCTPRDVAADASGDVFALCSDAAEAVVLEGGTGTIQTRLALPDTAETAFGVGDPASFTPAAEELHVATDTGVIRIDTRSDAVDRLLDVGLSSAPGTVAYDAARQDLYVARLPDAPFTERGTVTLHDRGGTQTGSFPAGIAPTAIDFRQAQP
ncbi:MAG: YncE family protein [Salinibacter sp.]